LPRQRTGRRTTQKQNNEYQESKILRCPGSDIEMIGIAQINEAYERLLKGDVKYRFVIDMASLKES